jgi:DNA-binding CsgD family transcriptional regulator
MTEHPHHDVLEAGRDAHAQRDWKSAHQIFTQAEETAPLPPEDLERLATAAYLLGLDDEQLVALERAYRAYLNERNPRRAAQCAFWLGAFLTLRGEVARATGWLGRAERALEQVRTDCVERGYLLATKALNALVAGDWTTVRTAASKAVAIAERFDDADLLALGLIDLGHAMIWDGEVEDGLRRLDEAMLAASAGELSPIVTGMVYCSVIDGCHQTHELRRADQWTTALTDWCAQQPDLVPFTGTCLVHRAEILQIRGAWTEALVEARLAVDRFMLRRNSTAAGQASYRCGEILRVQGNLAAAERAYREAGEHGWESQPGLALLRLAQGRVAIASAAISRVLTETTGWVERASILPAVVEIMLAAGDLDTARSACDELDESARTHGRTVLLAYAAQARGAIALAEGDVRGAMPMLRRASQLWLELEVPYEGARVRVMLAQACRSMGDGENAKLEFDAARDEFVRLGAALDIARVDLVRAGAGSVGAGGLTSRELQVLRMIASGERNRAIAAQLSLSPRTVDRHASNLYAKLGVSSRAEATAYAYQHGLV